MNETVIAPNHVPAMRLPVTRLRDLLVADVDAVHPRPAELDVEHAAGLLLVGVTAADTVATTAIGDGDVVVIHGGSGAVGTIAIQLASFSSLVPERRAEVAAVNKILRSYLK